LRATGRRCLAGHRRHDSHRHHRRSLRGDQAHVAGKRRLVARPRRQRSARHLARAAHPRQAEICARARRKLQRRDSPDGKPRPRASFSNATRRDFFHDRREQLDERRPADRRATIKPCSNGSDAHVRRSTIAARRDSRATTGLENGKGAPLRRPLLFELAPLRRRFDLTGPSWHTHFK
jgi:hypothetical protein